MVWHLSLVSPPACCEYNAVWYQTGFAASSSLAKGMLLSALRRCKQPCGNGLVSQLRAERVDVLANCP